MENSGLEGKVIIFSAPSGAGKTTVVRHLLHCRKDVVFSVSATTRAIREGEVDGRDYYFMSVEEFKNRIANNEFVEWEEVYEGLFYGTLKTEVKRIWAENKHVLFDVDVVGGINLKKIYGARALDIFVKPPSLEVLEQRLSARATESAERLRERIAKAEKELDCEPLFGTILLNNELNETLAKAEKLVAEFIKKPVEKPQ